ncbi:MAG: hypothetical protein O2954_11585 [bacterium]|nr:hypothetical protein [bacterium]
MYASLVHMLFSQLAVGGMLALLLVPHAAGRSFFRFCSILCLALLGLAFWVGQGAASGGPSVALFLGASGLLMVGFLMAVLTDRLALQKPILAAASAVGTLGILLDGWRHAGLQSAQWVPASVALYFLVSALFLGSVIFAMILGHWYLVVPTLPIGPLRSLTLMMVVAILTKVILAAGTIWLYWTVGDAHAQQTLESFLGIGGFFVWARILFGLVGPLGVAYMTWETVKINSTQSATGLLYVATIFALIGESLSHFVYFTSKIPI